MPNQTELAKLVIKTMLEKDAFSQWLGIELIEAAPERSVIRMEVRPEMLNGFGVCHGGVTFSLADSALAFASNSHGRVTMSIDNQITYSQKVTAGDVLTATAEPLSIGPKIATYQVTVTRADSTPVAHFRGTVYRTKREYLD